MPSIRIADLIAVGSSAMSEVFLSADLLELVAWCIIVWNLGDRSREEFHENDKSRLAVAEVALCRYLLDEAEYPKQYVPHVIISPLFTHVAPPMVNALLHSSLGATIEANGGNLWVVAFIGGNVIVLVIALEVDAFTAWTFYKWLVPNWTLIPGRVTHDKHF